MIEKQPNRQEQTLVLRLNFNEIMYESAQLETISVLTVSIDRAA